MGRTSLSPDAGGPSGCPFWRFSLEFYRAPDVQTALLEAQDRFGADVNMLLFALWRAKDGYEVSARSFAELDAAIAGWRNDVIVPLRAVRRAIRGREGVAPGCYQQAKALELACEHAQQVRMFELSTTLPARAAGHASVEDLAVGNLRSYATSARIDLPSAMESVLSAALRAPGGPE